MKKIKLYNVEPESTIYLDTEEGMIELKFEKLDGMYSRCYQNGNLVHLAAFSDVYIKEDYENRV